MDDLQELIADMDARFTSGNSVLVRTVQLTAAKWSEIRSALESAQALQAAPEGWVLVPREPTEAMLDAPPNAWPADAKVTYAAMLSAAPSPTAALQAGEV